MAIKSKNIKYSKWLKLAAAIIAVVMFFSAGWFANLFIRSFADYNSYDGKEANGSSYTQTIAFREALNDAELALIREGRPAVYANFEDYLASAEAVQIQNDFDSRIPELSAAYDLLAGSDIEVYNSEHNSYLYLYTYKNLTYCMNYAGEFIDRDSFVFENYFKVSGGNTPTASTTTTTALEITDADGNAVESTALQIVDGGEAYTAAVENLDGVSYYDDGIYFSPNHGVKPPLEVQDIANALNTIASITDYTSYGESSKERFIEEYQKGVEEYLRNSDNNMIGQYYWETACIKNVNYAIFYNGSDKVVTNCGVGLNDTDEQIFQKLGGSFVEGIKDGKYTLIKGEPMEKSQSLYYKFNDWLCGSSASKSILQMDYSSVKEHVGKAYFSFDETMTELDPLKASQSAYHDFIGYGIFSPNTSLALCIYSLLVACAACIYLVCVAGKTPDGRKINFFYKVPYEIYLVLCLGGMFLAGLAAVYVVAAEREPMNIDDLFRDEFFATLIYSVSGKTNEIIGALVSVFFMAWTWLSIAFAGNVRNKTFIKHTLCYQLIRLCGWIIKKLGKVLIFILKPLGKVFKKIGGFFKKQIDKIKYFLACDYSKGQGSKFKTLAGVSAGSFAVVTVIYYLMAGMLLSDNNVGAGALLLTLGIIGDIAILLFVMLLIVSLDRIMAAVSDIKQGELNRRIDTQFMPPFMRRFAEDILSMQDGLQNAVESAVKDQRMKAELITNVSHDLKTPLTSIVNYVDLLKKCDVQDEIAQRYINVLDEKAAKMKKLIEDLVEASKASSGAMEIHPVKINLCEFAAQAAGEHEDELKKFGIGLMLKTPEAPVTVLADSQKTSRIVENLFSNIRKYALEGTRVYLEVSGGAEYGKIVFKNISKYPLDVSADELTQRFVRGDSSRSGEGSGLGLSIAQNLCELQKGKFKVDVDGDLFKVSLELPNAQ